MKQKVAKKLVKVQIFQNITKENMYLKKQIMMVQLIKVNSQTSIINF